MIRHWNGPKEVAQSPSLEVLKRTGYDTWWHGLVDVLVFDRKLDSMTSEVFSNLFDSVVL